jgi:phosphotransferase system enzyme I (PtsI)
MSGTSTASRRLEGRPGAPGLGVGHLHRVSAAEAPSPLPGTPARIAPNAVSDEQARLRHALEEAARDLADLAHRTSDRLGDELGQIFEAQALFAHDPSLVGPALELIAAQLVPAAAAFQTVADGAAAQLAAIDDEYLRERAADVRDVARRVVGILEGRPKPQFNLTDGSAAILAAHDLDASEIAVLRPQLVIGIALGGGAPTGHAAIVARAIGIPMVLGLGTDLDRVPDGTYLALDGDAGTILLEPTEAELSALRESAAGELQTVPVMAEGDHASRTDRSPASLGRGLQVVLAANIGSVREAEQAARAGAQGIGLVRTELLFLGRNEPPGLDEQRALYLAIRRHMAGRSVVFRTLDIGGDKPGLLAPAHPEANPALGVRGLRLGLRRPELLEVQLRALLEASAGEQLEVMFPMVATLDELEAARRALTEAGDASRREGRSIASQVRLGIMVEVPSAAVLADVFAERVDFFSIGTNDLAQYTLAADRTHPDLADLTSALQPAVLRLVRDVASAARAHDVSVSVCGEAAGDPLAGPIFVGLGVGTLSVGPGRLAAVRRVLDGLSAEACGAAAEAALGARTLEEVRTSVTAALDQGRATGEG